MLLSTKDSYVQAIKNDAKENENSKRNEDVTNCWKKKQDMVKV